MELPLHRRQIQRYLAAIRSIFTIYALFLALGLLDYYFGMQFCGKTINQAHLL